MKRFVELCDAVCATTKKLEKVRLVGEYLATLPVEEAPLASLFLTGRAFPRTEEKVLGVGPSSLYRLVSELTGKAGNELSQIYRRYGDLGDAAAEAFQSLANKSKLTLQELEAAFANIAEARGAAQKYDVLKSLLAKSSPGEAKYTIKIITGDLRIGLKESLVEEGIAKAFDRPVEAVRRANMLLGNIASTLRLAARDELASARFTLFHPVDFMLATPVETAEDLFAEDEPTKEYLVEEKYDGIRAQIHKSGNRIKIFSRTLDEVTEFPELTNPILALPGEFILDGEILGWENGRPLPFTAFQSRLGRKSQQMNLWGQQTIPIRYVAFDLLYWNEELLLDTPLHMRRRRLSEFFAEQRNEIIQLAPTTLCRNATQVIETFRASLASGHEGVMAKDPTSPYLSGKRGGNWFKLKEPFATLDVVVTAVEFGHGRRHKVLSDYTFAVRSGERLLNIGKAYSGLTDEEIAANTEHFMAHTIEDQGFHRTVEPDKVIEVAFNNIQKSNRHDSGYALRFPRIVRQRPDKPANEIDTLQRVEELFARQGQGGATTVEQIEPPASPAPPSKTSKLTKRRKK
jgi:DNA ligase 1